MLKFLVNFNIISLLLNVPEQGENEKTVFTSFHCFFQYTFLSTFLAVFTIQCLVANGRIPSRRQERNIESNDSVMAPPGKLSVLSTIPAVKDRVSPTRAFNYPTNNTDTNSTNRNGLTVDPSGAQASIGRANAKAGITFPYPTTVKRLKKGHSTSRRWWRVVRSKVGKRRSRFKSDVRHRRISVDTQNVTNITDLNYTTIQGSVQNKVNLTVFGYSKKHPCNSVNTTAMKFKTGKIECRRLQTTELQQQMNCRGMFNHQYLASSFKEALRFKDLDTGKKMDLKNSFVLHHSSFRRQKRGVDIDPGETLVVECHATKTPTESGHLRICPSCSAITRQPSTPRRFPEYINELLCDPQMVSTYLPGIDAFCIQKTFTLDLLQFADDWELNPELSAEAGHDVYTEKWEVYTQTIRRHCACELLPSSPIAMFL